MDRIIQAIPLNSKGDLLFLKEFREENGRYFIKYRAMINEIPFKEEEIFLVDNNTNFVIVGGNGVILYRFPVELALKTVE